MRGNIIFDVHIKYNNEWSTFIAFEPYSPDEAIAAMQEGQLAVSLNQVVNQGHLLGRLVVPDPVTEFPHVHWGVYRKIPETADVCPRHFTTPEAGLDLEAVYLGLGLEGVCLACP